MLTLAEARKVQRERSEKAITKFGVFVLLDALAILLAFLLSRGGSDMRTSGAIIAAALLALAYQIKITEVYLFFTPREFTGTVEFYDVQVENVRDNLSNLPGDRYKMYDVAYGEMIVKDSSGRSKRKKFLYTEEYTKIDVGTTVTILRFIDRPVIGR